MESIKFKISIDLAKKILGNIENAKNYILELKKEKNVPGLKFKTISRGPRKGVNVLSNSSQELWKIIVNTWDYEISKKIIRKLFKQTEKYRNGKDADSAMKVLLEEWRALGLGEIGWPFSQGKFDDFVQRINSESVNGGIKDEKVKAAAVKYRRIKEINTLRNDFIETLIFEKSEDILPTLSHSKGLDFFINGIPFDQKVAKSPTGEFKKDFQEDWRNKAIENPNIVAQYLYQYQDEGRFDANPRLLVVYIDEDISIERIKEIIDSINLSEPIQISFVYDHEKFGRKKYTTICFVILLHI